MIEAVTEDRWLSVDEIGAYLGVKRDIVYRWIAKRQMPVHRIGRLKFRREAVDEWVRSGGAEEIGPKGMSNLRAMSPFRRVIGSSGACPGENTRP